MAKTAAKPSTGAYREVIAIVLLGLGVFLLLSLISYEPKDVSILHRPPNDPAHNFGGPVGAWLGCGLYFVFGSAAYLVPVMCLGFGWAAWVARQTHLGRKAVWALVVMVSGAALVDMMPAIFGFLQDKYELMFLGGFIGNLFVRMLSIFGKGELIIFIVVYAASVILLLDAKPGLILAAIIGFVQDWRRDAKAKKETIGQHLDQREKDLERKTRELTEEVDRRKKDMGREREIREIPEALRGLMPVGDPKYHDRSIPAEGPTKDKRKSAAPVAIPEEVVITAAELAAKWGDGKPEPAPKPAKKEPEKKEKPAVLPVATTDEVLGKAKPPQDDIARVDAQFDAKNKSTPAPPPPLQKPPPDWSKYILPPIDKTLDSPPISARKSDLKEDLKLNAQILEATLREFGIEVQMGDVTKGPVITRYEIHPAPGVKVEKISSLNNNIALAMKAQTVRILAPIPGKSCVGIEVPNPSSTTVYLRDVMEAPEWKTHKARIPLALGKDVAGNPIIADLADMPHLLVAGATGSGKTVCINAIIACLLHHASPADLRFLMIDPKIVEMQIYNGLPHLMVPVVTDAKKVILALRYVINEMERRYQMFAKVGVRNIAGFNSRKKPAPKPVAPRDDGQPNLIEVPRDSEPVIPEKIPYIVIIVDELADLMLVAPADVENAIARLAQLSRAVGIHMILATQRPSVDVITGVIKANFPARIAFQMASKVDSRTILDANGADKLLGKGDMLYLPPGSSKLIRAQGVFIQDEEIRRTVEFIKGQSDPFYELTIHEKLQKETVSPSDLAEEEDEELVEQAMEILRTEQRASVSLLQRRMRIGYTRAARIMDLLEERKIVGPNKGAEPRDILIDLDGQIK